MQEFVEKAENRFEEREERARKFEIEMEEKQTAREENTEEYNYDANVYSTFSSYYTPTCISS